MQEKADAMAALERQARAPQGFVAASTLPEWKKEEARGMEVNPDAIDIDEEDL